ncbi:flagellar hook protein FlgE [Halomonas urumqiensis]|uniref:Flagellar hook protein FlgE n=1 Tax=Halomonas urumqiensis TaxID=1684789 RepID=A0A2N7UNR7_9GAMM|nr:flagellar hook protein FlgE [Halomonas urumqiensis]PMR82068.1 flagellar hook protein FlgE [Halomonas urumqiensis]PTB02600.1 flagellar hook protein FlgE [Halomonas urumqiensis]GHE21081.1 flagellar hook protein FlgE [Halomonas urumqiensis]
MSFSQALSGLNAQSSKLGTIGNNISNSQTVGFKSSSAQFADVFANSKVGLGTRVSAVLQNFSEGNLESTNRNLDLAVAGQGFFRLQQPSGEVVYSRNGQLTMTSDGDLVNAQGAQIMGYGLNAEGQVQVGGQPVPLNVEAEEMPASATTNVATTINLDARSQPGEGLNSVDVNGGADTLDYHFSNNFTAYDSLGNPRNFNIYYEKTGNNTWTGRAVMDGSYTAANDFTTQFSANGVLATPAPNAMPEITFDQAMLGGEPADLAFTLDLAGSTQFGNNSTTSQLSQNGYTSGSLVGIEIEDDGTVMRNYANEQSRPSGQIALASFRNPEGLNPSGDNVWSATEASGAELVGEPGTGLLGLLQSGAIETSNVDMARELVDMIVTQRAYQANSQTIKTQDELLQTAINLR